MDRKSSYPAVSNGGTPEAMVLRTSVSALTAFDPFSYAGCHRRWWFTRVAGVKEEETVAQGVGKEGHAQAEHFEKTGEDILGPVMRAGKKYLLTGSDVIVEAQFGDLERAIKLRQAGAAVQEIEKAAGLCASGIPLDGYIDFRHSRGEYIDGSGTVQKEDSRHGRVVEVGDHKTTSSIENFSKSSVEMASTIQMIGYANYVLNVDPAVDHVRLSHIYYQTRGPLAAKKVTALVSAEAARKAWERIHVVGAKMEEVARIARVEEVEASPSACKAYRGCPHVSRCPVTRTFAPGGKSMSLFNKSNGTSEGAKAPVAAGSLFGAAKPTATLASVTAEYEQAKVVEKAKLAEADASYGTCLCGVALTGRNTSKLQSGQITHIGCPRAGVTPPDAPKTTHATAAVSMTTEQISKVEDAEIRQRATEHAAVVAKQPVTTEVKSGRCAQGGQRVLMNEKQKMSRSMVCTCGKEYKKLKDEQIDIQDTGVFWIVPSHNMPKIEAPVVVAPVVVQDAPVTQAAPVVQPAVAVAPVQSSGILPLEDYYLPMVRELEETAGAADIRCAPEKSELGFGKWRGALSAYVRMKPPAPGIYITRSNDEVAQEVVNTLRPLCAVGGIVLFIDVAVERDGSVVRGIR